MKISSDLNKVHQAIYDKLQLDKEIYRQEAEAKKLTNFLRSVKMNLYTDVNFYATEDGYANAEQIKEYLRNQTAAKFAQEMLSKTIESKAGKKISYGSLLFKAEGQEHTFEKVFSLMQNMALSAIEGIDLDKAELFRGGQTRVGFGGNVNDRGSLRIALDSLPKEIAQMALEQLQKYFGRNLKSKDQHFLYFNQVNQKIDNQALTFKVSYNAQLSPYANGIYKLLLTRNFSLKNYYKAGTHGLATEELEIGNTTFFRSLVSALQYSGLSYEEALKYFYRGISAIEYHNDANVIEHFNHLKSIYEFTGAGQKIYTGDGEWVDLQTVDFLVYNDPSSTEIQVISIKAALKEALEKMEKKDLSSNVKYVVQRGKNRKYWKS